jgi:hypothetical protein
MISAAARSASMHPIKQPPGLPARFSGDNFLCEITAGKAVPIVTDNEEKPESGKRP